MRTIPDMLHHDVCNSLIKNYDGDSHLEICVIDECVRERHDELR